MKLARNILYQSYFKSKHEARLITLIETSLLSTKYHLFFMCYILTSYHKICLKYRTKSVSILT